MSRFGDVSLDHVNPNAGNSQSYGKAHQRLIGLTLYINNYVSNVASHFGALPGENFFLLNLEIEKGWQRVTLPPVPAPSGQSLLVDKYGIRIIVNKMPSGVMSMTPAFIVLQVVVFFRL